VGTKILVETGKPLKQDYRNWIQTSFLSDLGRLITMQIDAREMVP